MTGKEYQRYVLTGELPTDPDIEVVEAETQINDMISFYMTTTRSINAIKYILYKNSKKKNIFSRLKYILFIRPKLIKICNALKNDLLELQ